MRAIEHQPVSAGAATPADFLENLEDLFQCPWIRP